MIGVLILYLPQWYELLSQIIQKSQNELLAMGAWACTVKVGVFDKAQVKEDWQIILGLSNVCLFRCSVNGEAQRKGVWE